MKQTIPVKLEATPSFLKAYRQLPSSIQKKVDRNLQFLLNDITHPGLQAKKMTGMGGIWEARVDLHYRFTFEFSSGVICLRTVGSHEILDHP